MDYRVALELQLGLVAARKSGLLRADAFLLLEHASVLTLGLRGGLENLSVSESFLKERGIPIVHVERGGNITYHGPGQLVGYPIMDLHAARLSVSGYVNRLEEVMICTAASFGVRAGRNALNRGVWVDNSKIGSIGIAIRGGITFHGFAFNVNLSLEPFGWINPCGLQGIGVTSLEKELSCKLSTDDVRREIERNMERIFCVELKSSDLILLQCHSRASIEKREHYGG